MCTQVCRGASSAQKQGCQRVSSHDSVSAVSAATRQGNRARKVQLTEGGARTTDKGVTLDTGPHTGTLEVDLVCLPEVRL